MVKQSTDPVGRPAPFYFKKPVLHAVAVANIRKILGNASYFCGMLAYMRFNKMIEQRQIVVSYHYRIDTGPLAGELLQFNNFVIHVDQLGLTMSDNG